MSDEGAEITIDARRFAGVWANAVRVNGSHDEITIDFARLDPVEPRGIVVSRVTCSPLFLRTHLPLRLGKSLAHIEHLMNKWSCKLLQTVISIC